jgi:hypothetical protein
MTMMAQKKLNASCLRVALPSLNYLEPTIHQAIKGIPSFKYWAGPHIAPSETRCQNLSRGWSVRETSQRFVVSK